MEQNIVVIAWCSFSIDSNLPISVFDLAKLCKIDMHWHLTAADDRLGSWLSLHFLWRDWPELFRAVGAIMGFALVHAGKNGEHCTSPKAWNILHRPFYQWQDTCDSEIASEHCHIAANLPRTFWSLEAKNWKTAGRLWECLHLCLACLLWLQITGCPSHVCTYWP